jgi:ribosomal protein L37AE/L43A
MIRMASATCPYCDEPAFSSSAFDSAWQCPTCARMVQPGAISLKSEASRKEFKILLDKYTEYWFLRR